MRDTASKTVKLRYFAWVREKIGREAEEVVLPSNITTVADLVGWLKSRGPEFDSAFARPEIVRAAIDKVHVKPSAAIGAAGEIAFFPPVTGG
jgi:molybdopterin synthase sulfur carrier subunit